LLFASSKRVAIRFGKGSQMAVDVAPIPDGDNQDKQLFLLNGKHHAEVTDTQS
jgi:hypothetical protein